MADRRRAGTTRRWRIAVVVTAVALAASLFARYRFDDEARAERLAANPRLLHLVEFNALKSNRAPDRAAAWIAAQHPDIVVLEEALGSSSLIVRRLAPLLPYQVSCLSRMRCSTVILASMPPRASGGLAQGDPENRKTLSAAWSTFDGEGGPFTVIAVHLGRPWPWGDQSVDRARLAGFIRRQDHRRLIVAGDFNLPTWTRTMRRQDRQFALPRLTGFVPSWPAIRLAGIALPALLPIDHVYAGRGWQPLLLRRGPWLGSDHYPLSVVLSERPANPTAPPAAAGGARPAPG